MVIIPLLSRQTFRKIKGVLRIWAVILAANLIGAQVVAGKTSTPYLNEYGARRIGEIGSPARFITPPESRARCRFVIREIAITQTRSISSS
jgi:hypothetical protein